MNINRTIYSVYIEIGNLRFPIIETIITPISYVNNRKMVNLMRENTDV
jgi:hypothetical protein